MRRTVNSLVFNVVKLSFIVTLFAVGCGPVKQHNPRIATAANVQYALAEIVDAFYRQTGITVDVITGSSGKMSTQITQGAPFDIFISANMEYPMELYRNGFAASKPKLYAYGEIVIWTIGDIEPAMESLLREDVHHVAIPNPKSAPYGLIAIEALKNARFFDSIANKIVYGANTGQVSQFITSGAAEIGLNAKSMIMSPKLKGTGNWAEVPTTLYTPIEQGIVVINRKEGVRVEAQMFYEFMFTDITRSILLANGYKVPES